MGEHRHGDPDTPGTVERAGDDSGNFAIENPGLPPHRPRITDEDPRAAKRAERQVSFLFILSILGTILFFVGYFGVGQLPADETDMNLIRLQNTLLGLGTAFAMLGIGVGIVQWGRALMPDHEWVEERESVTTEEDRADAVNIINDVVDETQIKRRPLLRNTLIGALAIAPLPAIAMFRDLDNTRNHSDDPAENFGVERMRHTVWDTGTRLVRDVSGTPIKASDVTIGSALHVVPDGLLDMEHDMLNQKAKAVVLLMRLNPDDMQISAGREDWHVDGIVAYSKICTHVGCPIALYEQHTHHLLCPCHQSTYDLTQECKVIFGPASHPLPQLPISVDNDGYLVAQSDFQEPVGPVYWERDPRPAEERGA
ncbi:Rieske 2Fe-2S domain-containing protein [Yaniella flava]|uniref:Cytochrome bc1 complex Rieske iron-sulfur subunit n=1 Tax=Yaniella flava TaxID=287930 RepID=A0ABP5FXB3_9MICC